MAQMINPIFFRKNASGEAQQLNFVSGITLEPSAAVGPIHGGHTANDDLKLLANNQDARPYIRLYGAGTFLNEVGAGQNFNVREEGVVVLGVNRTGSTYTTDVTTTPTTGANTGAFNFDHDTVTTASGCIFENAGLTTGTGLLIKGDSDALTTGPLFEVIGGASQDKSWLQVIENSNDTEGCQVIIDGSNTIGDTTKPSLRIGDSETGLFNQQADFLNIAAGGTHVAKFSSTIFTGHGAGVQFQIMTTEGATSTNPVYVFEGDDDTGIGWAGADQLSLIAGGVEGMRFTEASSIVTASMNSTANTTQDALIITGDSDNLTTGALLKIVGGAGADVEWVKVIENSNDTERGQLILPLSNQEFRPSLEFGTTGTGLNVKSGTTLILNIAGNARHQAATTYLQSGTPSGYYLKVAAATAISPALSFRGDIDTGIGRAASDQLSLIAGGVEAMRFTEASSIVTASQNATANTTQNAHIIVGDSDNLTTGALFQIDAGAGQAQEWFKVIENSSDTEGCQVVIDGSNTAGAAAKPSLRIGTTEKGLYSGGANILSIAIAGVRRFLLDGGEFRANTSSGAAILDEASSATNPVFTTAGDGNTGIGFAAADALSMIAGAVEGTRWTEVSSHILQKHEANVGLTADAGSSQGDGVLLSTYNVISTCANAGDAVTLPATFPVGTIVKIKNDGAQSCDVFPATGDDLGAGTNTAAALAAGASITYIGTVADTDWTSIGN